MVLPTDSQQERFTKLKTLQVAYTFDAGPNAVLIARNRKAAALLLQKLLYYFPPESNADLNRYLVFCLPLTILKIR